MNTSSKIYHRIEFLTFKTVIVIIFVNLYTECFIMSSESRSDLLIIKIIVVV